MTLKYGDVDIDKLTGGREMQSTRLRTRFALNFAVRPDDESHR